MPALPVVVPAAAGLFGALLWRLRRRGSLTAPRAGIALTLCLYAAGVVANTIFPIYLDKPARDAAWDDYLVLVPFADYELADAVMNVVVFVPLGFLMPLLMARISWWRAVVMAAGCSLAIEVTQLVTAHSLGGGHVADVDDLLFNVVGGAIGATCLVGLSRAPGGRGLVERFRWRPQGSAAQASQEP